MAGNTLPNELSPVFLEVISKIKRKVTFNSNTGKFMDKNSKKPVTFEYVEEMLTEELSATDLHYDKIGEEEFQRIFEFGLKALTGEDQIDEDEMIFQEDEEDEEIEDEEEENPEDIHFALISEIIEEIKANPDTDEEYLEVRIRNGLKTRGLELNSI